MKKFLLTALALTTLLGAAQADAKNKPVKPDQLEQCGAFVRIAPWCGEALEADTRQLQAVQVFPIFLSASVVKEWMKIHKEKRRGIAFVATDKEGKKVQTGRPVLNAVARVIGVPPSDNSGEARLFQALVAPDMSNVMLLLPAESDFSGWSIYILSSEGKHALTLSGEIIKLNGRHRSDGNLSLDLGKLPTSKISSYSTLLVSRGDGNDVVEALEATFVDHKLVKDRNGSTRVYSGLRGTFTPISQDGTSVVALYSNCRTVGQRLVEKGNLRVDTTTLIAGPVGLAPQVVQNLWAIFRTSCR